MTPLIDWDTMAFKAAVSDARNLNNTTTEIKAYGGDYGALRSGDIYLKENFTNYPRIMVVHSDDRADIIQTAIWESWELDFALNQSKGRTSIIKNTNHYWYVYGYNYSYVASNVTYQTTKKYFSVNGNQNCSIVEIYGLGNKEA